MKRDGELEKLFNEYLDRLLAGEKIDASTLPDEDMRTALAFAKKLAALGREPSAEFAAQLKTRLVNELAAKEEAKRRKTAGRRWFRQPVWQAAGIFAALVVLVSGLWASGVFNPRGTSVVKAPTTTAATTSTATMTSQVTTTKVTTETTIINAATSPGAVTSTATTTTLGTATTTKATTTQSISTATTTATKTATTTPATTTTTKTTGTTVTTSGALAGNAILVKATASTDKQTYTPGDTVRIQITLQNMSNQIYEIKNAPSAVSLMQSQTKAPVYTIIPPPNSVTLKPGESTSYYLNWDQKDFQGQQVAAGSYYVELEDLDVQGVSVPMNLGTALTFSIQ
jgi:hypothetical protein